MWIIWGKLHRGSKREVKWATTTRSTIGVELPKPFGVYILQQITLDTGHGTTRLSVCSVGFWYHFSIPLFVPFGMKIFILYTENWKCLIFPSFVMDSRITICPKSQGRLLTWTFQQWWTSRILATLQDLLNAFSIKVYAWVFWSPGTEYYDLYLDVLQILILS